MSHEDLMLVCRTCASSRAGTSVSAEAMAFLTRATTIAADDLGSVPLGARAGRELESAHRRLISAHLEKELKSARVLREMRQARLGR